MSKDASLEPYSPEYGRRWAREDAPAAQGVTAAAHAERLISVCRLIPKTGKFWYLGGPMTGHTSFNFPEFDRIAGILRDQAYPIVSPSEFEHESVRSKLLESNGEDDRIAPWADCLARDLVIISHPRCVGVILIPGWETSSGARLESAVADGLNKPLFIYEENPLSLTQIDRIAALLAALDAAQVDFRPRRADFNRNA